MGTRDELARLTTFLEVTGTRPLIDRTLGFDDATAGFTAMENGNVFGKVVLTFD
jgi:NADPH:quinone reductase-like Zn-dependent oxidoreductase